MPKKWIWEDENYPNFTYNKDVLLPLIKDISFTQGKLSAFSSMVSSTTIEEKLRESFTDEIINTSAIEGEFLNRDSVKRSIDKKLGLDRFVETDHKTDGLVSILFDAYDNHKKPLTTEKIFKWHAAIFPTGYNNEGDKVDVGTFRGNYQMIISSSKLGDNTIYYQAPSYTKVPNQIETFLKWFNTEEDNLIKAGIAHLWFLIIHPLDDGNGRISRTICEYSLARVEDITNSKLYSISKTINKNKKKYYTALENTTGFVSNNNPTDITTWLTFFLETLLEAIEESLVGLQYIVEKTKFWDMHRNKGLNARQTKVMDKILDIGIKNFEGGLTKKKYSKMAKASESTATNDLKQLIEWGCIIQIEGTTGRGTKYTINIK